MRFICATETFHKRDSLVSHSVFITEILLSIFLFSQIEEGACKVGFSSSDVSLMKKLCATVDGSTK